MRLSMTKRIAILTITAIAAAGIAFPTQAAGKKKAVTGTVNINTASREELMMLPGIGKAKADAVIAYRQQQPFASSNDLLKVSGIGPSILNQVQEHIAVDGTTALQAQTTNTATPLPTSMTPPASAKH